MQLTNYTPPLFVNKHIPIIGSTPVISYNNRPLEYFDTYAGEVINKKEYRRHAYFRWKKKRLRAKSRSIASINTIENRTSIAIVDECFSVVDVQHSSRCRSKHRRSSLKKTQPGL